MRLVVQQCSNKQSCSSHIFAYVKERYTNSILNGIEWQLNFMLFIRPYKQDVPININKQKTRKHEIVKHQSSKIELSSWSLNTSMHIFNKETEKAGHFSA